MFNQVWRADMWAALRRHAFGADAGEVSFTLETDGAGPPLAVDETVIFADDLSPSLLIHLPKVEGGAAEWQSRQRLPTTNCACACRVSVAATTTATSPPQPSNIGSARAGAVDHLQLQ